MEESGKWDADRLPVKEALKCKTCEIVTPDWLDFSTQSNKRLDETRYSHLRALKKARERERKRKLRIEGLKKAEREVDPCKCCLCYYFILPFPFFVCCEPTVERWSGWRLLTKAALYHPYTDRTFFQYTVELTRDNEETGRTERYVLTVSEISFKLHCLSEPEVRATEYIFTHGSLAPRVQQHQAARLLVRSQALQKEARLTAQRLPAEPVAGHVCP